MTFIHKYKLTKHTFRLVRIAEIRSVCAVVVSDQSRRYMNHQALMVGWLFWKFRPFETVFQSISGRLPEKGKDRREKKMSRQPHPHPLQAQ